jgi:peptidoglycan/LPS O-acetylase OafA/YrhL
MERERVTELDLLRFIAAASVVLFHAAYWPSEHTWFTGVATYGFMGVPLFFTISGFVILMSVQNRTGAEFAISRVARLYPTFWICVLLSCIALALLGDGLPPLKVIAANLTMLPGMVFHQPSIDPVYWTLAVEMKFYALVLVLLLTRQIGRVELFLALWLAVASLATVVELPRLVEVFALPMYASLFCSGCYLYLIRAKGPTAVRLIAFGASVLLSAVWVLRYQAVYTHATDLKTELTVVTLLLLMNVVFLLVALRKWTLPPSRIWLWLGCLTYPLYLTHAKAGQLVWRALPGNEWARVWIVLALVLLVSAVLAALVERRLCGMFYRLLKAAWSRVVEKMSVKQIAPAKITSEG